MNALAQWIDTNKEWLFSGVGVVVLAWIGRMIYQGKQANLSQKIRSGTNSSNIQGGRDILIKSNSKPSDAEEK